MTTTPPIINILPTPPASPQMQPAPPVAPRRRGTAGASTSKQALSSTTSSGLAPLGWGDGDITKYFRIYRYPTAGKGVELRLQGKSAGMSKKELRPLFKHIDNEYGTNLYQEYLNSNSSREGGVLAYKKYLKMDIDLGKLSQVDADNILNLGPKGLSLQQLTAEDVIRELQDIDKIEENVNSYNQYVLSQITLRRPIDFTVITALKKNYPFLIEDDYERLVNNYNRIVNSGLVFSNVQVNYRDLVLAVPSFKEFVKDTRPYSDILDSERVESELGLGFDVATSRKRVDASLIKYTPDGKFNFTGEYKHPKVEKTFKVSYNPRTNTFTVKNKGYQTQYVKKPFDIFSAINNVVKKKLASEPSNFVYMPRITVDYQ